MISYLEGNIVLRAEKFIILNVNGVGYKVFLSRETLNKIPENSQSLNPHTKQGQGANGAQLGEASPRSGVEVKVFCYLAVKENALELYGFLNCEELDFFETLLGISGIGPKAALEIASLGPLEKIRKDIEAHNEKVFEGVPGIGRKKAQAIILELSGRIREIDRSPVKEHDEAEEALVNLGFPRQRVKEVLASLPAEIKGAEDRIKQGLKMLGRA